MGRNIAQTEGTEVITKQVPVGVELKDQRNPTLAGDLNAAGQNIKDAGDIECKTINGDNLLQIIDRSVEGIEKRAEKAYALKDHTHPEVVQLQKAMDLKADRDHRHPLEKHTHDLKETTGSLPLTRLEDGEKVKDLLGKELCPLQHGHPNMEKAIIALDKAVVALRDELPKKLDESTLKSLTESMDALADVLRKEIQSVEKKIPSIPQQVKQVIGIRRLHVPYKGEVAEIVGRDEEGTPVKVTVTRSGKEIKAGDVLAVDDILSLSPATASVRIRFI